MDMLARRLSDREIKIRLILSCSLFACATAAKIIHFDVAALYLGEMAVGFAALTAVRLFVRRRLDKQQGDD